MNKIRKLGFIRQNYAATNKMGKLGLERFYEDILHGTVGSEKSRNPTYADGVVRVLEKVEPISGKDIYLHLDLDLQKAAANAFKTSGC